MLTQVDKERSDDTAQKNGNHAVLLSTITKMIVAGIIVTPATPGSPHHAIQPGGRHGFRADLFSLQEHKALPHVRGSARLSQPFHVSTGVTQPTQHGPVRNVDLDVPYPGTVAAFEVRLDVDDLATLEG